MNRRLIAIALLTLAAGPASGTAGEARVDGRVFTLPDGFEVERVAGPPLVDRPIVADFDERGRLYVADSSGSNDPVGKQLAEKPHRVVCLIDDDGDGRYDRRTIFADKLMFPEGAMWLDGSLYVAAPPSIWKLTDTDGDGVADRREEWFKGKTLTGCANDLHGPYAGPDGWIYWCKGAFAGQTYERPGKSPLVTRAAHIFRARPDGTGIEPVMTGGMDNPVEVAFTPGGEPILTATFLQHPEGGRRDGLIHAVYGGVYGKVHDVLDGHPRTGPGVMPVLTHLGPAAPCGLARYESDAFGEAYRGNLFATLFNLHKVTRHVLTPAGSTFTSRDEDFLATADLDFHPTDVLEDADGSLLVLDTGGWYKLCCPTSQLVKPDVLGAIYRVRRSGAKPVDDPRGLKLAWSTMSAGDLAKLLDDPRPAVRRRAVQALGRQGVLALPALEKLLSTNPPAEAATNAVWAATRIASPSALDLVRPAFFDDDPTVRMAAIHSAGLRKDLGANELLKLTLKLGWPQDARPAAEALGRIGDSTSVPVLLEAAARPIDRVMEHSITYALIEIADPRATAAGLARNDGAIHRVALIALDQMEGGGLEPGDVAPLLAASDPGLKEAATWIIGRHPEWAGSLAGVLRDRLAKAETLTPPERTNLAHQLAQFAQAEPIRDLLADRLRDEATPPETARVVLTAMAESGRKEVPAAWIAGLTQVITGRDGELTRRAIATIRALPVPAERSGKLGERLLAMAREANRDPDSRLSALAAVPGGAGAVDAPLFAFLRESLAADRPVSDRLAAADVLAIARLTTDQLRSLAGDVKTAGPLEVDRLLAAFGRTSAEAVGLALVAALEESPAMASLRPEALRPRLERFGASVQKRAAVLYEKLDAGIARQRAELEPLLSSLTEGDARRGQVVFNGAKAACATCHAIGYLGGRVGPDLTKVGAVRSARDLLEAIALPSASFVRSFEPVVVATKDGRTFSGLLRKDAADEVVLTTAADQEARIARGDVEAIRPGTVSVMPAGLDKQLTRRELADLLAFLKACR